MTRAPILRIGVLGAATALGAAGLSASAQPTSPTLGQCIDQGASWTAFDDHRILARLAGRTFLVITDACPRLNEPLTHIVVDAQGGTPICGEHDVRLYVSSGAADIRTPCAIRSINRLSQDEARVLESTKP